MQRVWYMWCVCVCIHPFPFIIPIYWIISSKFKDATNHKTTFLLLHVLFPGITWFKTLSYINQKHVLSRNFATTTLRLFLIRSFFDKVISFKFVMDSIIFLFKASSLSLHILFPVLGGLKLLAKCMWYLRILQCKL